MSLDVQVSRNWNGFSLDISFASTGGTLGILGESGCGKSMTLKSIAGLVEPKNGTILLNDTLLFDAQKRVNLPPQKRNIGYLFQSYALFPHMTVEQNIACALHGVDKTNRKRIVADVIKRFALEGLETRYPSQISGGQQQRVALARILAYNPKALLLDEPFSALDFHLKEKMQLELKELLRSYQGDTIIVTHSRDEAFLLCEQLLIMENGRCIASGKTRQLFENPRLLAVARITGCKNISAAVPLSSHRIFAADWGIELTTHQLVTPDITHVGVRAHDFCPAQAGDANAFAVQEQERLESPFEWNILLSPALQNVPNSQLQNIWWKVARNDFANQSPQFLRVAPKKVMLLRKGVTSNKGEHNETD